MSVRGCRIVFVGPSPILSLLTTSLSLFVFSLWLCPWFCLSLLHSPSVNVSPLLLFLYWFLVPYFVFLFLSVALIHSFIHLFSLSISLFRMYVLIIIFFLSLCIPTVPVFVYVSYFLFIFQFEVWESCKSGPNILPKFKRNFGNITNLKYDWLRERMIFFFFLHLLY